MANGEIVVINSVKGIVSSKAKEAVMKAVLTSKENDSYIENSILGTPVYDNLILGTLIKENRYLNLLGETESFAGLKLNQVLITPTATNNIVTKPIQGKNGTIKQYISRGDVSLSIRGTISGKYNQDTGKWLSPREVGTSYHPKE